MSERWLIYKNDQTLGPFTSEEVRNALRDGSLDPFDLVAREGSSVQRELLEVDEIFVSTKVVFVEGAASHEEQPEPVALRQVPGERATEPPARPGVYGQGHLALASDAQGTQPSQAPKPGQGQAKRRRDPKHFYILDAKGRRLGPVTAGEIQTLFYKGVLDKSARILRDGSQAKVPVNKFVAVYAEGKNGQNFLQGSHPQMAQRVGPKIAPARGVVVVSRMQVSLVTVLSLIAATLLTIATVVLLRKAIRSEDPTPVAGETLPSRKSSAAKLQREHYEPAPRSDLAPNGQHRLRADPRTAGDSRRKHKRKNVANQIRLKQETREKRAKTAPQRLQAGAALPRQAFPDSESVHPRNRSGSQREGRLLSKSTMPNPRLDSSRLSPPAATENQRAQKRSPQGHIAAVAPVAAAGPHPKAGNQQAIPPPKPNPVPAPYPPSATPPSSRGVAALANASQANRLGPMTFDRQALAKCTNACTLMFTGAGGSVRGAFFKQAWGPTLAGKRGGVYLTGRIIRDGGGVKIIVANVQ